MLNVNIKSSFSGFEMSVDTRFPSGITGVFGHSGAGKSTLLNCISGLHTPSCGEIRINGETVLALPRLNEPVFRRKIGYVFQNGRLFPHLSIEKNLLFSSKGTSHSISGEELLRIVRLLDIENLLNKYPGELSGGECQRVALGRALLMAPRALLFDEPFSALDKDLRSHIVPYVKQVAGELDVPVLVVSHDLADLLKLTRRLCVMDHGHVVAHGDYEEILTNDSFRNYLPFGDIINVVRLKVVEIGSRAGIIGLNGFGAAHRVKIMLEPETRHYKIGDRTQVFLRPDDIVLSKKILNEASFRNQLPGTVLDISYSGSRVICRVDCGFSLIALVSRQAVAELKIEVGSKVYCSFKSLALDAFPVQ